MNIVPFWKTFVTRKMSTIFKSGLYSTFSNATIVNKNNSEVSHSKREAINVISTLPSNSKNYCRYWSKRLLITTSTFLNSGS